VKRGADRRLRDLGEHPWLATLARQLARRGADARVVVGPGDDAAVVRPGRRPVVLTTDTLVDGRHFRRGWLSPAALGRRAFAVNASDVAAMGARPTFALLALEVPARTAVAELDALVHGFAAAARRAGASLVGGNVTAGPHLVVTVALLGEVPGPLVTRAGARPGDGVYVTGTLGGTGLTVRRLLGRRRGGLPAVPDRVDAGARLAHVASAMIDVSDGLLQDLGHVCRASGVAAIVEASRLPLAVACRRALGARAASFAAVAGEDYELAVTVPPRRARAVARIAPRLGCRLTCIGTIVAGRPEVRLVDAAGRRLHPAYAGFDHFRRR
jgi:thiamine-monophosphate kinase